MFQVIQIVLTEASVYVNRASPSVGVTQASKAVTVHSLSVLVLKIICAMDMVGDFVCMTFSVNLFCHFSMHDCMIDDMCDIVCVCMCMSLFSLEVGVCFVLRILLELFLTYL